ncbi:MAG: glycosyltransferase [Candidatus Delongbacteria bacterium]|nr:glycosyltransferase [Candidatus Delongbacteria bacterium]
MGTKFQQELRKELNSFFEQEEKKFSKKDLIKIDLHCHDHNSDVTDELLGRILNVQETWLKTEDLVNSLRANNCDVVTITNHNSALSNFQLLDKGIDALVGAEFSCIVPDYEIGIHVLAYGFTKEHEVVMLELRENLYDFLKYCRKNDIPTIWAHPLFHYKSQGIPPFDFFCKLSLLFERFEVVNGQRNTWQNLLIKIWLENTTKEDFDAWAKKFNIDPYEYCNFPYKKVFTGGSDSHMGIFAGQTGSYLYVRDLENRKKKEKLSDLALEAIKKGDIAVYGSNQNTEKLTVAFIDYFNQICLNFKDPGLNRLLLHKGSVIDKTISFIISNAISEIQNHKVTIKFIDLFHKSFLGKIPNHFRKLLISKAYKPIFDSAVQIAEAGKDKTPGSVKKYSEQINKISDQLNHVLFSRLKKKLDEIDFDKKFENTSLDNIISFLELPTNLRKYSGNKEPKNSKMAYPDIPKFLDGLSFPMLTSLIILAANFTSSKTLTKLRPLYNQFAEKTGKLKHPKRMLWLTDTYGDKNGVSMSLQAMHEEIKKRNLPIDILVCSDKIKPDDHLIVLKPEMTFTLPFYKQQELRIPNFLKIHSIFQQNEYDRIICSTEGIMGLASLYLKHAFSVPTNFYIHTDWITFTKDVLGFDIHEINRVRRYLRAYYGAFDKLFVLNTDQKTWLNSNEMGFKDEDVIVTAHWVDEIFKPIVDHFKGPMSIDDTLYFMEEPGNPIILYAGRISKEKGVMELPQIYYGIKKHIPDIKIIIAGTGPAEDELKKELPEGKFTGWINHDDLPGLYSSSDLFILPSKFDTFGCVVIESMSCGLPVISYNTKGPKDIIQDEKNGYLVETIEDIIEKAVEYLSNKNKWSDFKNSAVKRSKDFNADKIVNDFLKANDL